MIHSLRNQRRLALAILASICVAGACSARAEDVPETPLSALIVFDHGGKTTAVRIEGEGPLAMLERYFPNYRLRPESGEAGAWEAKYEVFINFKYGQTYRLLVSPNSRYWSMGRGDFELRGYFSDFVAGVMKAKNPRGIEK